MKNKITKIFLNVFLIALSALTGLFIAKNIILSLGDNFELGKYFLWLALYLILLYAVYIFHIIVHECGHLIFGLLTGYKFSSFRIGSFIITKRDGKIKLSRFVLAGTAGQCLLSPPEENEGAIPYRLYNFGGVILNLLLALAGLILYFIFPRIEVLSVVFMLVFAIGVFSAAANGIPVQGIVNNDGYNGLSLGKDKHALRSFANQLSVNGRMTLGERLRDMPPELFELAENADKANPINNTITVFKCNRLMDEHRFDCVRALCKELIACETVLPIYKNMLVCDLAFCEMLAGELDRAQSRFTEAQKKFMAAMANNPSIIRTQYALALLCEKDGKKAEKYLANFEKAVRSYPYKGDVESERELIEAAKKAVIL